MTTTGARIETPTAAELHAARCKERGDRVNDDAATSAFKAAARLHQARWREARGYPIGTQPLNPRRARKNKKTGEITPPRDVGSNLELKFAMTSGANFLSDGARQAVAHRLDKAQRQKHEMLNEERLYASLLFTGSWSGSGMWLGPYPQYTDALAIAQSSGEVSDCRV